MTVKYNNKCRKYWHYLVSIMSVINTTQQSLGSLQFDYMLI